MSRVGKAPDHERRQTPQRWLSEELRELADAVETGTQADAVDELLDAVGCLSLILQGMGPLQTSIVASAWAQKQHSRGRAASAARAHAALRVIALLVP